VNPGRSSVQGRIHCQRLSRDLGTNTCAPGLDSEKNTNFSSSFASTCTLGAPFAARQNAPRFLSLLFCRGSMSVKVEDPGPLHLHSCVSSSVDARRLYPVPPLGAFPSGCLLQTLQVPQQGLDTTAPSCPFISFAGLFAISRDFASAVSPRPHSPP
jgi:hypothetical protein